MSDEFESKSIVIGEIALNELIIAIQKQYFADDEDYGRIKACDELVTGIKAVIDFTDARVTKENGEGIWDFRDCEDRSDMAELLDVQGGELRVKFYRETEVHND